MDDNNIMANIDYSYNQLKPLREKDKDEYQPQEQQIQEYAQFLGVQLPQQEYMLQLVRQGIVAQLPQEWQACQTPNQQLVYRNTATKQIQQEHPLDEIYRQKILQLREYVRNHPIQTQNSLQKIQEISGEEDNSLDLQFQRTKEKNQVVTFSNYSYRLPSQEARQQNSDLNKGHCLMSQQMGGTSKESFRLVNLLESKSKTQSKPELQLKSQQISMNLPAQAFREYSSHSKQLQRIKLQLMEIQKQKKMKQQILTYLQMSNQLKMEKLRGKKSRKSRKIRV